MGIYVNKFLDLLLVSRSDMNVNVVHVHVHHKMSVVKRENIQKEGAVKNCQTENHNSKS